MKIELNLNWDGSSPLGWIDYTNFISLENYELTKSLDENNDPRKSYTGEIVADGDAYLFIYNNLANSVNLYSNYIIVRVLDDLCDSASKTFKLENSQLSWCDNSICKIQLRMIEWNPQIDCLKRTTVADNTLNEFQDYPASGFPHPRIRYCDVFKPTIIYGAFLTFVNGIIIFIVSLNLAIASIVGVIVWLVNIFGGSWTLPQISYAFAEDMLGCGRGYPSPFVRSYISNVCTLCGINVDQSSMPIFYEEVNGGIYNPYYQTVIAYAPTKKGVDLSGVKGYIPNNQPSWTLAQMMSILKKPFNARWFLKNDNTLYFERKDKIGTALWGTGYAIDLSILGDDYEFLVGNVCRSFNGEGKAKKLIYKYGTDATDNIGNELKSRFNGIFQDNSGNPNYNEVVETVALEFGTAACVLDGQDSAYDVNIDKALSGVLLGTDYAGCLKTQGDTFALAKLLLYNTNSPINDARCDGSDYDIYGSAGADIDAFADDDADFFPLDSADCKFYNYPFSFDPDSHDIAGNGFKNLWQFHQIDAPQPNKKTNIDIELQLRYCCRYESLQIYQKILLEDGVDEAEITYIHYNRKSMIITVKGKLK